MATLAKAVLALALSEYKRLLDKHVALLQLSNMVDEEETQSMAIVFLSLRISLFTKGIEE